MKAFFCLIFLFQIVFSVFPQEKKEIELNPIEIYLSTHNCANNSQKINLYGNESIARKYVCFLLEQEVFGSMKLGEIDFFEDKDYWLVCIQNEESKFAGGCDSENYVLTFLLGKDDGEISAVIRY